MNTKMLWCRFIVLLNMAEFRPVDHLSPCQRRELYRQAGVGEKRTTVSGSMRQKVPNVLREDVEDLNADIEAHAARIATAGAEVRARQQQEREECARVAAKSAHQRRMDHAATIALSPHLPQAMAEFLASRDDESPLTNYEVRLAMQTSTANALARRDLLTTEKKKVRTSAHYPVVKHTAPEQTLEDPASGHALRSWYRKVGLPAPEPM
jgi:hypothetical protein